MKFGYIRVSTTEQNTARQEEALRPLCDELVIDRVSGKDTKRDGLELLLLRLRAGDELLVKSIDRLSRNTRDLLAIIDGLMTRGVVVRFLDLQLNFDSTPMSRFILTMMGAVAELERGYINTRQKEGVELAKQRGAFKGKQPNAELRDKLAKLLIRDITVEEAAKIAGCGRTTVYRIRAELQDSGLLPVPKPRATRYGRPIPATEES